jgi:DHA1 family bicyclomycin/chloramphenicol resistance-like MFS transporter
MKDIASPSEPPAPPRVQVKSRRLVLPVLGTMTAFAPLSIDMYLPAFPTIQKFFATDPGAVQLTLAAFFAAFACGQVIYGPLTDRFGRKPPLYAGLGLYAVTSVLCTFAPSIEVLIVLRFFQGLGACSGPVIARAVINDLFEKHEAVRAYAGMMLVSGLAPMLAPILGGYVLLASSWQMIFFILALLGVACLTSTSLLLPETNPADASRPFGLRPVFRIFGGLLSNRHFLGLVLGSSFAVAAMFAFISGSPFIFIDYFGLGPDKYSWLFGANAFCIISSAQVNARLVRRFGSERLLAWGRIAQVTAGIVMVITSATGFGGMPGVVAPLFVVSASIGFIITNSTALAMGPHRTTAGSASAMIGVIQFGMGGVIAAFMGWLQARTPLALALVITFLAIAGQLAFLLLHPRENKGE